MALSDLFPPGSKCPACNKDLNKVANGEIPCGPCLERGEEQIAQLTVLQHLLAAFVCIFHFRFWDSISEFSWTIERLFKIGDYHPETGEFYRRGFLKSKK
jgi:hypothetical protein